MRIPHSLLLAIPLALLTGCVAYVSEHALVRPTAGKKLVGTTSSDGRWSVNAIDIARTKGVTLYAAHFTRPDANGLLLYFGGNGFVISKHHQVILDAYAQHPVDVLMVDHRGYGGSGGNPSLDALLGDAVAVYDFVNEFPPCSGKPIIVHGQSLGSFMAGEVARERQLDGLVLESSATTAEDWVQGFVDNSVFVRRGVVEGDLKGKGNLKVMHALDEPVLIVVGERDNTTRSSMSVALYSAARVPGELKELLIVPAAGHNNAILSREYHDAFKRLLSKATSR